MINYKTHQRVAAPEFAEIDTRSPFGMPGAHEDVYNSVNAQNAAALGAARDQASVDFANEKLAAQRNAALAGMQNLMQARRNQEEVANRQAGMRMGLVNGLLSGLFR